MKRFAYLLALMSCALLVVFGGASASAATKKTTKKKAAKALVVCRRGCPYSSVQKAVNAAKKGQTVKIKPGRYVEGVNLSGHGKDNIKIVGLGLKPEDTVLEGKGAKTPDGNPAQNGIFADGVDNVTIRNITAQNYPANGFFVRNCHGYLMDHVIAGYNRAYGLYAFNCIGGRMTYSVGYGHGDSAFYVGQTPVQDHPETTLIDHVEGYLNVLGYSGTNSKYIDLRNSEFYNNGAGIAPNTLQSEKFPPARDGVIQENLVYWNNFNYFNPDSKVKPLPAATGGFQYPTGVGIVLFGITNWTARNNFVFGNFRWGIMSVSDPTYATATNFNNKVVYNTMGGAFGDANGSDIWTEGTGKGNCWENNSAGTTFDAGALPQPLLYPGCKSPNNTVDPVQIAEVANYLTKTTGQEGEWSKHPHPARPDRKPVDGLGG